MHRCYANAAPWPSYEGSGGGEIRTHEAFRPSGFQDRRDQPLCHPSDLSECAWTEQFITRLRHYAKRNRGILGGAVLGMTVVRDFLKRLTRFSSRNSPIREVSPADRYHSCKDRQDTVFHRVSSCAHKASNPFRHCLKFVTAR